MLCKATHCILQKPPSWAGGSCVGVLRALNSVGPTVLLSVLGPRLHYVWTAWRMYYLWLEEGWAPEDGRINAGPLGFPTELKNTYVVWSS